MNIKKWCTLFVFFSCVCVSCLAQSDSATKPQTIKTITMINADKDSVDIHCIWELDTARCRLNKTLEGFKRRSFKIKHISPLIDTDDYHGYYVKCDDDTGYIEYSYSIRFPKKEGAHILIIEEARLKNNKYISELPTTRYTTQPCILSEMRLERYSIEYIKSISEN